MRSRPPANTADELSGVEVRARASERRTRLVFSFLVALVAAAGPATLLLAPAVSAEAPFVVQAKIPGYGGTGFGGGGPDLALSADGNTAVIGDPGLGAWVFARAGSSWSEQAHLQSPSGYQNGFGQSVALSADGNTALVGGGQGGYPGTAAVFVRSGSAWSEQRDLGPAPGTEYSGGFGWSVALSADGNTALVGGPFLGPEPEQGAAWAFTRSQGKWSQFGAMLKGTGEISSAVSPLTQADFGRRVALSSDGRVALVSGWRDNSSRGAAWVFERSASGWIERGKLTAGDEVGSQQFGDAIALSGDGHFALIGGSGAIWDFERAGTSWVQRGSKITVPDDPVESEGQFGWSVALSGDGNTAAVGARNGGVEIVGPWILRRAGTAWSEQRLPDPGVGNLRYQGFGEEVALSDQGTTALISAPGENTRQPAGGGAVWVFVGPPWSGSLSGTGAPAGAPPAAGAPHVAHFSEAHRRWREGHQLARISRHKPVPIGTTFSFALNEPAMVTLAFAQHVGGRSVKGRCRTTARRSRTGHACRRTLLRGALQFAGHAGLNHIRFQGRVNRRRWLPPGSYVALLGAKNRVGERSATSALDFVIVR